MRYKINSYCSPAVLSLRKSYGVNNGHNGKHLALVNIATAPQIKLKFNFCSLEISLIALRLNTLCDTLDPKTIFEAVKKVETGAFPPKMLEIVRTCYQIVTPVLTLQTG